LVDRVAVEARLARLDRELSMIEQVRRAGRDRFLTNDGLQHRPSGHFSSRSRSASASGLT
jgi:hypothetical protein